MVSREEECRVNYERGLIAGLARMDELGRMRDLDEIVRAHDILAAVLLGEVEIALSEPMRLGDGRALPGLPQVSAALSALCWVLLHPHSQMFALNLAAIEAAAEAAGYRLKRTGEAGPRRRKA